MCKRCDWVGVEQIYIDYHDKEWGVPCHNDDAWFEFLLLEGAQAGLSWITVLKKREGYREAFDGFDVKKIAQYDADKIEQLVHNPSIIRNRRKVEAAITNAKAFIKVQEEFGSFDQYIWRFVNGKPKVNNWSSISEVPAYTTESDALSKDLIKRGFKFVGTTICYALMQATGLVNDHLTGCFRYQQIFDEYK